MDKKTLREAQSRIGEALSFLEVVRDDEQEKFDDKSDTWKESERGEKAQADIEALEAAIEHLNDADSNIETAMSD